MSLTINLNKNTNAQGVISNEPKKANGTIDGRNLKDRFTNDDAIAMKRKMAQRQAKKLVGDAWGRDEKLAQGIRDLAKDRTDKVAEKRELETMIENAEKEKERVRERYGLDPDSQEQKDYELLEKYQNNINGAAHDSFTKEEINRLWELKEMPRTEYQKEMLSLNGVKSMLSADLAQIERDIEGIAQGITDAKSEQDKSQDMLKSHLAADELLKAAEEDILAMLYEDGKKNIDETAEEQQEKAEEAKEKKEEEEEKLQKIKEEREQQEEIVREGMEADQLEQEASLKNQAVDHMSEAQKAVAKILKDNNLISEDLKGIDIDLNF